MKTKNVESPCEYINPTNSLEIATSRKYVLSIRTMYKFDTTDKLYADLLNINVEDPEGFNVNVVNYAARPYCGKLRIRMVVGTDIPNTYIGGGSGNGNEYNPKMTNELQNCSFVRNLRKLGIQFEKVNVIQIHNWQIGEAVVSNSVRIIITELHLAGIDIIGYYIGEPCYTTPTIDCGCGSIATKLKFEILTSIIEVNQSLLQKAIDVIYAIDLQNYKDKSCNGKVLPPVINKPLPVINYGTHPNITQRIIFLTETSVCDYISLLYDISQPNNEYHISVFTLGGFADTLNNGKLFVFMAVGTTDPRYIQSGGAGIPISPNPRNNNNAQMESYINTLNKKGIIVDYKIGIQYFATQDAPGTPGSIRKPVSAIVYNNCDLQYSSIASAPYVLPPEFCPCSYFGFKVAVQSDIFIVPPENINSAIDAILK